MYPALPCIGMLNNLPIFVKLPFLIMAFILVFFNVFDLLDSLAMVDTI